MSRPVRRRRVTEDHLQVILGDTYWNNRFARNALRKALSADWAEFVVGDCELDDVLARYTSSVKKLTGEVLVLNKRKSEGELGRVKRAFVQGRAKHPVMELDANALERSLGRCVQAMVRLVPDAADTVHITVNAPTYGLLGRLRKALPDVMFLYTVSGPSGYNGRDQEIGHYLEMEPNRHIIVDRRHLTKDCREALDVTSSASSLFTDEEWARMKAVRPDEFTLLERIMQLMSRATTAPRAMVRDVTRDTPVSELPVGWRDLEEQYNCVDSWTDFHTYGMDLIRYCTTHGLKIKKRKTAAFISQRNGCVSDAYVPFATEMARVHLMVTDSKGQVCWIEGQQAGQVDMFRNFILRRLG